MASPNPEPTGGTVLRYHRRVRDRSWNQWTAGSDQALKLRFPGTGWLVTTCLDVSPFATRIDNCNTATCVCKIRPPHQAWRARLRTGCRVTPERWRMQDLGTGVSPCATATSEQKPSIYRAIDLAMPAIVLRFPFATQGPTVWLLVGELLCGEGLTTNARSTIQRQRRTVPKGLARSGPRSESVARPADVALAT
jgi:hypothetical protein